MLMMLWLDVIIRVINEVGNNAVVGGGSTL